MRIAPQNSSLLQRLQLFVVARPETRRHFDLRPFDLELEYAPDPLRTDSERFQRQLHRLDQVTFGPEGMPMPRWVFLSGAEMTGGIVGFGVPAADISDSARVLLEVDDDYTALVPLAVYIAIPTFARGAWFGHNLASIASKLPDENLAGLGSLTKAVALKMFRAQTQIGATQWRNRGLIVHSRLGPLELLTACTPAHGDSGTLTYRATISDDALLNLGRDPAVRIEYPDPDEWIESEDLDRIAGLQREIEKGGRFAIVGRPENSDDGLRVPIARLSSKGPSGP